ncbi:hypothetical protein Rhal01_03468 [Rubritalea halochordaticola]|uniref:DUF4149 domain-containing protein n=1 Tax=Rubritalea halochordaticola TaxID=714537 RepID=A0ABP9V5F7_9BACT
MRTQFPILAASLTAVLMAALSYLAYPFLMDWVLGDARQYLVALKPAELFWHPLKTSLCFGILGVSAVGAAYQYQRNKPGSRFATILGAISLCALIMVLISLWLIRHDLAEALAISQQAFPDMVPAITPEAVPLHLAAVHPLVALNIVWILLVFKNRKSNKPSSS